MRPADFPTNVAGVTTRELVLLVVLAEDELPTPVRVELRFTPADGGHPVDVAATSTSDGVISTRVGNAAGWAPLLQRPPFGRWRLTFPDQAAVRALLDRDGILDVALLVSYSGRTPEWPD